MSNNTIIKADFLPISINQDSTYDIVTKEAPSIPWQYNESANSHDWEGYIRVFNDGTYTFSAQIDDAGYIEVKGQKVVNLTGDNASTTEEGSVFLEAGYHYVHLHHENHAIEGMPNAETFIPMMDGSQIQLFEIRGNVVTINTSAKLTVRCAVSPLVLNRDVPLRADVVRSGDFMTISNIRLGEYDNSPVTSAGNNGVFAQISILSVSASFSTETVDNSAYNTLTRRARLYWTARIVDELDTERPDREVSWDTGRNNTDATFSYVYA